MKLNTYLNFGGNCAEGGEILMAMEETFFAYRFGQLRDKFGTSWMNVTNAQSRRLSSRDERAGNRVAFDGLRFPANLHRR
jgi:hypothetical protein